MSGREFWIRDDGGPQFDFIVSSIPVTRDVLVREVDPAYDEAVNGLVEAIKFYAKHDQQKAKEALAAWEKVK